MEDARTTDHQKKSMKGKRKKTSEELDQNSICHYMRKSSALLLKSYIYISNS